MPRQKPMLIDQAQTLLIQWEPNAQGNTLYTLGIPLDLSLEEKKGLLSLALEKVQADILRAEETLREMLLAKADAAEEHPLTDESAPPVPEMTREPVEDDLPADMRGNGHVIGRGIPGDLQPVKPPVRQKIVPSKTPPKNTGRTTRGKGKA